MCLRLLLRPFLPCLTIAFFLLIYLVIDPEFCDTAWQAISIQKRSSPREQEEAFFSSCVLQEFGDGWTKQVLRISNVDKDPARKCDTTFKPMMSLDKAGRMTIDQTRRNVTCNARSMEFLTDRRVTYGNWTELSHVPSEPFESDFVWTQCFAKNSTKDMVEDFIHIQVVKKDIPLPEGSTTPPGVYIFVIDSLSNSQALRSLPKTISLLQTEFEAVNMRHVNKVGENSNPNGIAMFFGKSVVRIDKSLFGMGTLERDWNKTVACGNPLDDRGFVVKDFTQKRGYVSLMAEDWASGVFNYPSCEGFRNEPVTHYMRPFQVHYESHRDTSRQYQAVTRCFEHQTFLYDYLDKFISQYPDHPKIAMTWASHVGHDDANNVFHLDAQLFNFFRAHREEFDRSFVFLLGDHGQRIGSTRYTDIGRREISNPALFISTPSHLRQQFVPVLKENAGKLLTTFDIHASFVDILNDPSLEAVRGPVGLRGNSIFRPLPPGERSCRSLPIPLQFCLCEWNRTVINDKKEGEEIGKEATKLLNRRLVDEGIWKSCHNFTFVKTTKLERIDETAIYTVTFTTEQCGAEFRTIVRVNRLNEGITVTRVSDDFIRVNRYGKTAECMNESRPELRPICCCK